jgi:uncharacterized protein YqiB (DUF1249 family)
VTKDNKECGEIINCQQSNRHRDKIKEKAHKAQQRVTKNKKDNFLVAYFLPHLPHTTV